MRINGFLIPGGVTSTRFEINSLLIIPFIILVFDGLSLFFPHTLLSLSYAPILAKGWGMDPRGEGDVDKWRERE